MNGESSRSTPHTRYRAKPVVINAILWTGGDYECLNDFCGKNWTRADAVDMGYDDKEQVVLWNTKERQYLHCPVGHWIIRGIAGELYPCAPDVFAKKYEQDNACQECNGTGRKLFKLDPGQARVEDCKACNATGFIEPAPVSETSTPEKRHQNPTGQVMFRAGLLACREYMARFVEVQDPGIAASIRANWWPSLGDDPGAPRKLNWNEVAEPWGEEERQITMKQIPPSIEALPEALTFLEATRP